jgi:hypothetical protein
MLSVISSVIINDEVGCMCTTVTFQEENCIEIFQDKPWFYRDNTNNNNRVPKCGLCALCGLCYNVPTYFAFKSVSTHVTEHLPQLISQFVGFWIFVYLCYKSKSKAIPVTGRGGLRGCEMLRIPHCLDNRLTVNCEILATCSSTYSQFVPHRKPTPSP